MVLSNLIKTYPHLAVFKAKYQDKLFTFFSIDTKTNRKPVEHIVHYQIFYTNGAQPAAIDDEICGRPHVI